MSNQNPHMKLCITLASLPILSLAASFLQGFVGRYIVMPLPIEGILFLIGIVISVALVIRMAQCLVSQPRNGRAAASLFCFICIWMACIAFLPSSAGVFLMGFDKGVVQRLSEEDFIRIAQAAEHTIPVGSLILPPTAAKSRGEPNNAQLWSELFDRTPLAVLPQPFVVYNRGNRIEIEWGSALTGHWGVRLSKRAEQEPNDSVMLSVYPSVSVFYTN